MEKQIMKLNLINQFMKLHKLSKTAFCKKCKISNKIINKIFANEINFDVKALFKIAKVLGVKIYELFEN